jgi:hypothetical protein
MKTQATFSELLQAYFTQRLMHECNASPHTIANYRDTFRLLIGFAHRHLKKPPTALAMENLDAAFVCRFLDHLEKDRGVSARSRNVRLAAIHSFFQYVALQECRGAIKAEAKVKRQKNGNVHYYTHYRCTKKNRIQQWCSQPYIIEANLDAEITGLLKPFSLREDWADAMLTRVNEEKNQRAHSCASLAAEKRAEIEKLNLRLQSFWTHSSTASSSVTFTSRRRPSS